MLSHFAGCCECSHSAMSLTRQSAEHLFGNARHGERTFRHQNGGGVLAEQLVSEFQGFVHRVDGCRKVHALGKTAVEFRHQNELRFLLRPRNGESFVGADLEVFFKLVLNGCRRRQAIEGFFEFRRTGSLTTPPFLTAQAALSMVFCI